MEKARINPNPNPNQVEKARIVSQTATQITFQLTSGGSDFIIHGNGAFVAPGSDAYDDVLRFTCTGHGSMAKAPVWQRPSSAAAPALLGARLAALGSSALLGRGRPIGRPATASGARELAASKAADFTAFDHPGTATSLPTQPQRATLARLLQQ